MTGIYLIPHLLILGLLTAGTLSVQNKCSGQRCGKHWVFGLNGMRLLLLAETLLFVKLAWIGTGVGAVIYLRHGLDLAGMLAGIAGLALLVAALHRSELRVEAPEQAAAATAKEHARNEQVRRDAADAARAKAEFMHNLNYELRTPLTSVLGLTTLLATDTSASERTLHLEALQQSSSELMQFVESVLEFIDADNERFELDPVRFSLRARLQHFFTDVAKQASNAQVQCSLAIDSEVPDRLRADHMRLTRVLSLLFAEVLAHAQPGGQVSLEIQEQGSDASDTVLTFLLRAERLSLSAETIVAWREAAGFGAADAPASSSAIIRAARLVALFGGELDISSPMAQLVELKFSAKLARYDAVERKIESAATLLPHAAHAHLDLRVLLVEDNLLNQVVAERLLTRMGCTVKAAEDGNRALELLGSSEFDVVLLDCELPGIDGYQVATLFRKMEDGQSHRTPIIALTAHTSELQRKQCLEAGMDEFMAKPIDMDQLLNSLRAIDQKTSRRSSPRKKYPVFFVETKDKPMC